MDNIIVVTPRGNARTKRDGEGGAGGAAGVRATEAVLPEAAAAVDACDWAADLCTGGWPGSRRACLFARPRARSTMCASSLAHSTAMGRPSSMYPRSLPMTRAAASADANVSQAWPLVRGSRAHWICRHSAYGRTSSTRRRRRCVGFAEWLRLRRYSVCEAWSTPSRSGRARFDPTAEDGAADDGVPSVLCASVSMVPWLAGESSVTGTLSDAAASTVDIDSAVSEPSSVP
mmetsp:Transcript_3535/g.11524  ORF Transcript_3535/g.11524 Transcript_3535/m.11524 type:complete len:231 (-) Transcript_3535:13-705(-)